MRRQGVSRPFGNNPDWCDRQGEVSSRRKKQKETRPLRRRVSYWRDRVTKGSRHRVSIPRILSSGFPWRTKEIGQIIGSSDTQVEQSFWALRTLRKDHCARDTRYIRIEWLDTRRTWPEFIKRDISDLGRMKYVYIHASGEIWKKILKEFLQFTFFLRKKNLLRDRR